MKNNFKMGMAAMAVTLLVACDAPKSSTGSDSTMVDSSTSVQSSADTSYTTGAATPDTTQMADTSQLGGGNGTADTLSKTVTKKTVVKKTVTKQQ